MQRDEIWSFYYAKGKNSLPEHQERFGQGDVGMRTAIDADTRLVLT